MKSLWQENRPLHLPAGFPSERSGLLKPGILSLLLHIGLVVFLLLNLMSPYARSGRVIYRVTLRPFSPAGDGKPPGGGPGLPKGPATPTPAAPAVAEKPKGDEGPRERPKIKNVEREEVSRSSKKKKFEESGEPVEGLKKTDRRFEKERDKSLQEALDEIHRKVALDEIQRRVARRSAEEKRAEKMTGSQGTAGTPSQGPNSSSSKGSPATGIGSTATTGTGTGRGPGIGTGTGSGSPWGSSGLESRLNDYYSLIWAKIKEGWTLPENVSKDNFDLEAVIVLVIDKGGKLQKSWFEKKSGNALYDQMAMRAIRKAEPFPPIPKELGEDSLEIGIRFYPE